MHSDCVACGVLDCLGKDARYVWILLLGLVQTSNFSYAQSNVNDLSSLFELIYVRFGT